jgi:hypothetical protein
LGGVCCRDKRGGELVAVESTPLKILEKYKEMSENLLKFD